MRFLAACLSSIAGFVDAIGFISLGGFFVSFMSGNTTRVGVGLADDLEAAAMAAGLVGLFVAGVVSGAIVGRKARAHRRPVVLGLVTALLSVAALAAHLGATAASVVGMVLAMGAVNAVFVEAGEVRIGVTYMTGTLVKLGKGIATAVLGGERFAWVASLVMWSSLLAGGLLGSLAYRQYGLDALAGAAFATGLCAGAAVLLDRAIPRSG